MTIIIPEDIFIATKMSENELKQEIAVVLFQKDKLTLGQASALAGMDQLRFQHLLASRKIPVHYDVAEFEKDIETIGNRHVIENPRIISDPNICGGEPCIKATRIPVHVILSHLAAGEDYDHILNNFPRLTLEDIKACLKYAAYLATDNR